MLRYRFNNIKLETISTFSSKNELKPDPFGSTFQVFAAL